MGDALSNFAGVLVGAPGTGKSTLANRLAAEHARSSYVIAHDPTGSYRGPLVQRHPTTAALTRALVLAGPETAAMTRTTFAVTTLLKKLPGARPGCGT